MNKTKDGHDPASAFTLVELLIAMTILSLLVVLTASLLSGVSRAWISGEQQVETFQDGRAITELISRELSQAVISSRLQLVQNPSFPPGLNQRANSDSIFWQAPATSTTSGDLAEIGYYLTADYQLKRFFVPPTDTNNYQIFSAPNQPTDNSALWVTSFVTNTLSNTVSEGVLAFWVRCLDRNGDLIPWLSSNAVGVGPLKFNSAGHFQPAIPGQVSSFKYTNQPTTAQAHLLPSAIEVTLITIDLKTMRRSPAIPAMPSSAGPQDIPTAINTFSQQLISNNIKTARTFTTRVRLPNAGRCQ